MKVKNDKLCFHRMKKLITLFIILAAIYFGLEFLSRGFPSIQSIIKPKTSDQTQQLENVKVLKEESVVIDVVKKVGPSVVTVSVEQQSRNLQRLFDSEDPFSFFFKKPAQEENQEQDIGSGFILQKNGLIVTNKHVVSRSGVKYIIIDDKGNKYNVERIYRDPLNDVAILKVANPPAQGFKAIQLGDSSKLEVGQFVIAIGTALGEFRNTVTTGVVSGLGRGITAGNPFEGFVERLDNVIQTDAAINPGNSGGPLLNSAGEVIGINTAVSSQGQNIGFAIPINIVKESLTNFNQTGQFNRPFLGVSYRIIERRAAILNDVPEGAYVQEVVDNSSAKNAGIEMGDIITKIDGIKINTETSLAQVIAKKKVGDVITVTIFRNDKETDLRVTLQQAPGE